MTKLTDEELDFIRQAHKSCDQPSAAHVDRERLLDHISAIASELSQARERIDRVEVLAQDRLDAAHEMERERDEARAELAALRATVPADGWKLVPMSITAKQNAAMRRRYGAMMSDHGDWHPSGLYDAALAAIDARPEAEVRQDERQKIAAAILEKPKLDLRADEASRLASALLHGLAREILKNHDYDLSKFRGRPESAVKAEALREAIIAIRLIGVPVGAGDGCGTRVVGSSAEAKMAVQRLIDRLEKEGASS